VPQVLCSLQKQFLSIGIAKAAVAISFFISFFLSDNVEQMRLIVVLFQPTPLRQQKYFRAAQKRRLNDNVT
jgi:hypothetical protein